ncbi:DUF305 domain-containing protein [Amycolatopsis sp. H20-H5]|uniref:DUF305 domain-containing protein n=1 Tax=Amycolatopsis sp. H20-H5 TaxID=3046309 RepID=UPI002DB61B91|nr:DUF305 domain-containing protein [Amycolatopsis sp. H20-H5]MEC3975621.1 DUF305 domain-containing protein [Amycolatopsis sp. H20-H5]
MAEGVRLRLLVALAAGLLTVASCGTGGTTAGSTVTAPAFNDSDVMFLQMMIPHHEQGVLIVQLARDHDVRTAVKELSAAIEVTQESEISDMKHWLTDWHRPTAANPDPQAHTAHGGMRMTDPDLVGALTKTAGPEFERRYLDVLTGHQHSAVELAQTETAEGVNPQAKELAKRIFESRTAEIKQLLAFTT